jgi:hypothetical protein
MEEQHKHVKLVLQKMEEAGLILKASKCEFHTDRTDHLGYVISPNGIQMDHEKVKTVAEWKEPSNIKGVQSFLGFANFYRRFIKDYSKITLPLWRLTRKDTPLEWNDNAQKAFDTLKAAMITEPILKHFDQEQPITLEMDASDYAIGAVCSQPDKTGVLHPIGYYSRKLKGPELNYDIHDKELLALVDGLRKFDTYCKSTPHKMKVLTDHKNLEYWQSKRDLNLRQARWGERLADYDFVITYRPGKLAGKPDILSRESGDSPWEGEMKHRQNKERVLLPPEVFQSSGSQTTPLDRSHEQSQTTPLDRSRKQSSLRCATEASRTDEVSQVDTAETFRPDSTETFRADIPSVSEASQSNATEAFQDNALRAPRESQADKTKVLRADTAEALELQIDHKLLQTIKDKTKHDPVMQETIAKL